MKNLNLKFCECGCDQRVSRSGNRFISGHNRRGTTNSLEHNVAISRANSGENNPSKRFDVREKMSLAHLGKKHLLSTIIKMREARKDNPKVIEAAKKRSVWCPPPKVFWTKEMRAAQSKRRSESTCSESTRQKTSEAVLKYYSVPENRLKKAIENSNRMLYGKYPFDIGYVFLPRLGVRVLHRSSYEKKAFFLLDNMFDVDSILVEGIYIPYTDEYGKSRIYIPDIFVTTTSGQKVLIEIKPLSRVQEINNQLKFAAAQDWADENNALFCVWTEEILYSDSVTTTLIEAIQLATVAGPLGRRYSLNSVGQHREGSRNVSLAC